MTRAWYSTAAVALLVVLAGCAGGVGPTPTSGDTTTPETTAPDTDAGGNADAGAATVQFYISDERNDIDDFESLEVTITEIGFQRAGDGDDEEDDEDTTTVNETTATTTTTVNETTATTTTTVNETTATETEDESEEDEDERAGWVTVDIEDRTVDLTELKGANASLLANVTIPNGTYNKVFIEVSETNGTLTNGETTEVKLPSERLHVNKRFTVGNNETVEFVYDVTAVKAGRSGKYILKPVVSQSGTDVPIDDVNERRGPPEDRGDERDDDERDDEDRGDERQDRERADLNVSVEGEVAPDETVTLTVTRNGSAVANATVSVNGEEAGTTAEDGTFTFTVPDAEELEVEIETEDDGEAELEYEFDADESGEQDDRRGDRGQDSDTGR